MPNDPSFWENSETVEWFAALKPDDKVGELLARRHADGRCRVLDVGCAGGRNTEMIARHAAETVALDLSDAMTRHTRERLASVPADERGRFLVVRGGLTPLPFASETFDLVVAIGVYVQANSDAEFRRALAETHRILRAGGRVFVTQWSLQTVPAGARCVGNQRFIYASEPGETRCRLSEPELIDAMAEAGFALEGAIGRRRAIRDGEPRESLVGVFVKTPMPS